MHKFFNQLIFSYLHIRRCANLAHGNFIKTIVLSGNTYEVGAYAIFRYVKKMRLTKINYLTSSSNVRL